jgi:hypothetical protein
MYVHHTRGHRSDIIAGMKGGIALAGVVLAVTALHAQTGAVRVRVIDAKGEAVPGATVTLAGSWGRAVRTLSTNRAGEVLWKKLPFGEWYFSVDLSQAPVAVCDSKARTITLRVAPPTGSVQFVVTGAATLLEIEPTPICATLDLPEPSRHK